MKKKYIARISFLALISVVVLLSSYSCKKDDSPVGTGKTLEFSSLKAEKDTILVQEVIKITASATGEGLSYSWKCDNELGVIEGTGAEIMFTICHAGKFKITCDISDSNNHKATKDVYVTTIE